MYGLIAFHLNVICTQWFTLNCIRIAGFAGMNALEEVNILMIGGCVLDTLSTLYQMYGVKEQDAKASNRIHFDKDVYYLVIRNPHWNLVLFKICGYDIFYICICHSFFKTLNKHQMCNQIMPQYGGYRV